MAQKFGKNNNKVYKIVLTGGPCGGKTTGQARLCSFFENLGWKVYRVPETASILLGGGVKFADLSDDMTYKFQENLLKTMMQIENTFFDLAASSKQNCLVICDRGLMDASAYLKREQWERMKLENSWNEVDLRDSRYNQVIHLVTAAIGAEECYSLETNNTRSEGVEFARDLDRLTSQAWVGHPYFDVVDNSTDFKRKVVRMIATVCTRLCITTGDRLAANSRKHKYVVKSLPDESHFLTPIPSTDGMVDESGYQINNVYPQYQDFVVIHDYLVTPRHKNQARIRRRGQNVKWDAEKQCWDLETGNWTYIHTLRKSAINAELKMQISSREYKLLRGQRDNSHYTIFKKRRCFLWNNQYFQMDIYQEPCHPRCKGLIILETYTASGSESVTLPDFLDIEREATGDPDLSMYNLSLKEKDQMTNGLDSPPTPGKVRHVSGPTVKPHVPDRTRSTSVTEGAVRNCLGS